MDKKFKVRQSGFVPKGKALPTKWTREVFIPIHLGRMEQKVDMSMFENALIRIKTNTGSYITAHENTGHVVQRTAHTNGIWKSTLLPKYGYNCIALTSPSTKRLLRAHRNKREIDQGAPNAVHSGMINASLLQRGDECTHKLGLGRISCE